MEIINILGKKLAQNAFISSPASRGLLKLAIIDELGPFKSFSQITYDDLQVVLQNSLKKRLLRLNVSQPENLINLLIVTHLIEFWF